MKTVCFIVVGLVVGLCSALALHAQEGLFLEGPYVYSEINMMHPAFGSGTIVFASNSYAGETTINAGTLDASGTYNSVTYGGSSGTLQLSGPIGLGSAALTGTFSGVTALGSGPIVLGGTASGSGTLTLGGSLNFDIGTVTIAPSVLPASSLSDGVGHLTLTGPSSDSTIAVPEPSSFILGALGLSALFAVRRVFSRPAVC